MRTERRSSRWSALHPVGAPFIPLERSSANRRCLPEVNRVFSVQFCQQAGRRRASSYANFAARWRDSAGAMRTRRAWFSVGERESPASRRGAGVAVLTSSAFSSGAVFRAPEPFHRRPLVPLPLSLWNDTMHCVGGLRGRTTAAETPPPSSSGNAEDARTTTPEPSSRWSANPFIPLERPSSRWSANPFIPLAR